MASILIVSHEPDVTSFIAAALQGAGHEVATAASGAAALEAAARVEYAIILIEILMPDVDGVETIVNLRKAGCRAALIALSGEGHLLGARMALFLAKGVGADAALVKPFSEDELLGVVSAMRPLHA